MAIIVLGRDGVINRQAERPISSVAAWDPLPGSIDALAALSRAGFQLVIATNQDGLARGHLDLDNLEAIHATLRAQVEDAGGEIAAIFYCPHAIADNCRCRVPQTGLLDAIEAEFNTSLHDSYLVGDNLQDFQAGLKKGCRPALVRTGRGEQTLQQLISRPDPRLMGIEVFSDLAHFSRLLLQ